MGGQKYENMKKMNEAKNESKLEMKNEAQLRLEPRARGQVFLLLQQGSWGSLPLENFISLNLEFYLKDVTFFSSIS